MTKTLDMVLKSKRARRQSTVDKTINTSIDNYLGGVVIRMRESEKNRPMSGNYDEAWRIKAVQQLQQEARVCRQLSQEHREHACRLPRMVVDGKGIHRPRKLMTFRANVYEKMAFQYDNWVLKLEGKLT